MADITFTCPYCEQRIEAPDEMSGLKAICPGCQCELQIPAQAAPPPAVSMPVPVPASLPPAPARQASSTPPFLAAKCPSCGGDLQVPDNRDQVKCMYCGGTVIIRQAIQLASVVSVPNLITLAKAAAVAQNHKEAYDYYTRALEYDPRNSEAWFGKGESAGWMSTVAQLRTDAMIASFANAINSAADSDKTAWRQRCSEAVTAVSSACYSISRRHLERFFQVTETWPDYVRNCFLLKAALYNGLSLYPSNKTALELVIRISADLIRGIDYTTGSFPFFHYLHVSSDCQAKLKASIEQDSASLSRLDPRFVKPNF
jgi:tetratricopeptide (TPR) repeat protein